MKIIQSKAIVLKIFVILVFIIFFFMCIVPLYWVMKTSFTEGNKMFKSPPEY